MLEMWIRERRWSDGLIDLIRYYWKLLRKDLVEKEFNGSRTTECQKPTRNQTKKELINGLKEEL